MLSVRTSEDIHTSKHIRGFREIRHSTLSKRLLSDWGSAKLKKMDRFIGLPQFDGFTFGHFKLQGGHLESQWIGQALDQAMMRVLHQLDNGGILYALAGNLLKSLYRRSRGSFIRFIIQLFYKIVIIIFKAIFSILWRIIIAPLSIIAFLLLLILLPLLL